MSGGSYDYLCGKDAADLLGDQWDPTALEQMCDRLAGLGYAADAAREATEMQLTIRQARTRVDAIQDRLRPVFKAIEWWDSCDWGEERVHEALARYRGDTE